MIIWVVMQTVAMVACFSLFLRMRWQRDDAQSSLWHSRRIVQALSDERLELWDQINAFRTAGYAPKPAPPAPFPASELVLSNAEVARQRLLTAIPKAGPLADTLIATVSDLDAIIATCDDVQVSRDMIVKVEKIEQVAREWNGQTIHLGVGNLGPPF